MAPINLSKASETELEIYYLLVRAESALIIASVASCECMTKTPKIRYHEERCGYKKQEELRKDITKYLNKNYKL